MDNKELVFHPGAVWYVNDIQTAENEILNQTIDNATLHNAPDFVIKPRENRPTPAPKIEKTYEEQLKKIIY